MTTPMTNPSDREVTVFNAALQLPEEQRPAYLDEACAGDAALRLRIEALLRMHAEAGAFLEDPAPPPVPSAAAGKPVGPSGTIRLAFTSLTPVEKTGDRIGRYKLLQQIGEGGCGVVYMAEQSEPVRRKVALKVIKLGMDTKNVIARFEAERQALALMDHPNIAKVFDAGATETGRPYFVMELVKGVRITDYCDQNNLPTADRLKLFLQVCQAIQHAHQKGIIHRDIKPSNILVTMHDGVPVPKVIDFGIAKATTDQPLTDKTLFTAFEQFIGTPAYMSPEQAEMTGLDIDTRSDVYALGVLLYELLTGKTPFDPKALLSSGLEAMRRTIREQEPERPSTALSTMLDADLGAVARHRQADAPGLIHLLRGDLDWIVMKTLEKDRTRRYETANGLAMDVQRYLANEPVMARPPSNLYRFQKLARRNKLAFAAAAAIAAALALGTVFSTWQAVRATRERRIATRERERADRNAAAEAGQRQTAERQRHRAEEAAQSARQALSMSLEVEGDRLAREGNSAKALAHFARALRLDPANRVAAQRIISMLNQRDFPLPLPGRPENAAFDPFEVAAYSSDGRRFCVITNQNSVVVFDSRDGRTVGRPFQFDQAPASAHLNLDGSRLMVGLSNTVSVWDCASGRQLTNLSANIRALSQDGRMALVGASVVEVDSGRELYSLAGYGRRDRSVFSPDGSKVAFLTSSNVAVVLASATGKRIMEIPVPYHGSRPYLRFTPNCRGLIIAGFTEGLVEEWDLTLLRQGLPPFFDRSTVLDVDLTEDGRLLVGGSRNGDVSMWNLLDGSPARETCPGNHGIDRVRCAPDGSWLTTWSSRGGTEKSPERKWWDIRPGRSEPITFFRPAGLGPAWLNVRSKNGGVQPAGYNHDGSLVKAVDLNGRAHIWRTEDGALLYPPITHGGGIGLAIFSPDSTVLATGAANGEVRLWDTGSGQALKDLGLHADFVTDLVFSPDGRHLASGGNDGTVKVWDTRSGKLVASLEGHWGAVNKLAIEPTGKKLAVAYGGSVRILGLPTLAVITEISPNEGAFSVQYSHDGRWLSTAYWTDAAQIWDGLTGKGPVVRLPHGSGVDEANFSSDDRLVVTASYDRTARVWDRASGIPVTEPLPQQQMDVRAVFSPNGRTVITTSRVAVVWDVRTGRQLSEEFRHEGGVVEACFSPDGRHILTAGSDGLIQIQEWIEAPEDPPAWLPDLAEAVGGYRLTENGVAELLENAPQVLTRIRQSLETNGSAPTNSSAAPLATASSLVEWGKWYLADRGTRPISPHTRLSVQDYAEKLTQNGDLRALEAALNHAPGNPLVYQKLAMHMDASQPESAVLYRRIAAELGGTSEAPAPIAGTAPASATPRSGPAASEFLDPLDGAELLKHENQVIKVKGEIIRFAAAASTPMFFLNFSGNYRSSLTLLFRPDDNPTEFRPELLRAYVHKTVVVEGILVNFQGRPEIRMKSLADIKEVEGAPVSQIK